MDKAQYEKLVSELFEHLNNLEEDEAWEIFSELFSRKQQKDFLARYISATLFSNIEETFDGRLEILGCKWDEKDQVFILPDKRRYRIKLELDD